MQWRALLQAADGNGGGSVKTAVIFNLNTRGQPVFCINVRAAAPCVGAPPHDAARTALWLDMSGSAWCHCCR